MSDEYERECRQQKRLEALGTDEPRCGMCGYNDDRALELHHVAGRKHDEVTVILCRNCHRAVSDDQLDHPVVAENASSGFVAIGHFLLGLADMLRIIVEKLIEFGSLLIGNTGTNRRGNA
jgi:hypothetical protein